MRKNIDWRRFIITAYADTEQPIDVLLAEDIPKILTSKELKKFNLFMRGQTGLILSGGQCGYYPCDFERFINNLPVID